MKKILLVLAVCTMMISCSSTNENKDGRSNVKNEVVEQTIFNTTWKLEKYSYEGKLKDVLENSKADITFNKEEGKITGNGSVNRYFGTFTLDNDKLNFGTIGSTRMMGPEDFSNQENIFTQLLGKVTSYKIEDGKLILLENDKEILVFKAVK